MRYRIDQDELSEFLTRQVRLVERLPMDAAWVRMTANSAICWRFPVERTGIEPVTSGLQSQPGLLLGFRGVRESAWLREAESWVPARSARSRDTSVTRGGVPPQGTAGSWDSSAGSVRAGRVVSALVGAAGRSPRPACRA
jgi:hypothetical protein